MTSGIKNNSDQNILFVGRDWERKGGGILYEAFQLVKVRYPNSKLTIVGPDTAPVSGSGIKFEGFLRKDRKSEAIKLAQLFREASVFCMPSICETWGLVYVEAALSELPIVGLTSGHFLTLLYMERRGI